MTTLHAAAPKDGTIVDQRGRRPVARAKSQYPVIAACTGCDETVVRRRPKDAWIHKTYSDLLDSQAAAGSLQAELTRVTNLYNRLLAADSQHQRDARAAARRAAIDDVRAFSTQWSARLIYEGRNHIDALIYRVTHATTDQHGRLSARDVRNIRDAAGYARLQLDSSKPAMTYATEPVRAENRRLRGYIVQRGRELHQQRHGDAHPELPCRCDGCELIRGMDAVPVAAPCADQHCWLASDVHYPGDYQATDSGPIKCVTPVEAQP